MCFKCEGTSDYKNFLRYGSKIIKKLCNQIEKKQIPKKPTTDFEGAVYDFKFFMKYYRGPFYETLKSIFIHHYYSKNNEVYYNVIFQFITMRHLNQIFRTYKNNKYSSIYLLVELMKTKKSFYMDGTEVDRSELLKIIFDHFRNDDEFYPTISRQEIGMHIVFSRNDVDSKIRKILEERLKEKNFYLDDHLCNIYLMGCLKNPEDKIYISPYIFENEIHINFILEKGIGLLNNDENIKLKKVLGDFKKKFFICSGLLQKNSILYESFTKQWMYDQRIWWIISKFL